MASPISLIDAEASRKVRVEVTVELTPIRPGLARYSGRRKRRLAPQETSRSFRAGRMEEDARGREKL
jgi:hypothetical protein